MESLPIICVIELPIRDGNYSWPMGHGRRRCSYWTSYKGWKPEIGRDGEKRARKVIELPIRDGNVLLETEERYTKTSYWTSYKGWKLDTTDERWLKHFRYWTSYKGWKPVTYADTRAQPKGYWTSYKGWKLARMKGEMAKALPLLNFL